MNDSIYIKTQTKLYKWAMRFAYEYNKRQSAQKPVVYLRHESDQKYVIVADSFNAEIMLASLGITTSQSPEEKIE